VSAVSECMVKNSEDRGPVTPFYFTFQHHRRVLPKATNISIYSEHNIIYTQLLIIKNVKQLYLTYNVNTPVENACFHRPCYLTD
jgi:hypothetical protein